MLNTYVRGGDNGVTTEFGQSLFKKGEDLSSLGPPWQESTG